MNVLSLFDGQSCGQIALNRLGIKYDTYFASEIDTNAILVTQDNYPKTKQIGDVMKVDGYTLPKIDLMFGGSPCTNFSFAGKRYGMVTEESDVEVTDLETYLKLKGEGFTFKGQSFLFWEYVRLLKEVKPKYFLLENVVMVKKWENIISETLGVKPIFINSASVSAQDRKRLYWTNIPNVQLPENKNIHLEDILEDEPDEKLFLAEKLYERYMINRSFVMDKTKSCVIGKLSVHQGDRVFSPYCKGSSLSASGGNNAGGSCNIIEDTKAGPLRLRRLSVIECERLQTVPDNYTKAVSTTGRYKMLGNGWTVDVIAHIFSHIKI